MANISKWLKCWSSSNRMEIYMVFQSDLTEQLNKHKFLEAASQILVEFCSNKRRENKFESNVPLECLEHKEQLEVGMSKGDRSCVHIVPSASTVKPEPTATLVAALADLVHNLVPLCGEQMKGWNEHGLFRIIFRCVYYSGDDAECVLRLRTSVCRALARASRACASTRNTLACTCDCLHALVQVITATPSMEYEDELEDEVLQQGSLLLGTLLEEGKAHCVVWDMLLDTDMQAFWRTMTAGLRSDNKDLQQAMSYCFCQLMHAHHSFLRMQQKLPQPSVADDFLDNLPAVINCAPSVNNKDTPLHSIGLKDTQNVDGVRNPTTRNNNVIKNLPTNKGDEIKSITRVKISGAKHAPQNKCDGVKYTPREGEGDGVDCYPGYLVEEMCQVLLEEYKAVTTADRIKELSMDASWQSLCSSLVALLSSSPRARRHGVHRDLPTALLGSLQAVRNYLTMDGQQIEVIKSAKKSPILGGLRWILAVIQASMCACAGAKELYADNNLSYSLNKLWPWLMMTEPLRDVAVGLLETFTNDCPKAWGAMHNCVGGRCLLLEVITLVTHEMAARSPTRAISRLTGALRILTHCTPHLHCRTIMLKSDVLSCLSRLHPAVARNRTAGLARAEASWELFVTSLARHQDAAVKLLDCKPVLCALAAQRGRMLSALCLIAFASAARAKLLHSAEILHIFMTVLASSGDVEGKVAVACAVWALAANNHKTKLVLRTCGLSACLGSCVQRLKHSSALDPHVERALQLLTYTHSVLQIN